MLFVSIVHLHLAQPIPMGVDGIELRLDLAPRFDIAKVQSFLQNARHSVMLTLRKKSQGGQFQGSEEERERLIENLLKLAPSFFDLEAEMRPEFLKSAIANYPRVKFILSHHDFEKTPSSSMLENLYLSMSRYHPFGCKIAAMSRSSNDTMRMLLFSRSHPKVSAICMGEKGSFARVLGKILGNVIDYANLDSEIRTGHGQISVQELLELYRYPALNHSTAIYGLIGDPIEKSPGAIYHNGAFAKKHRNAVYVKMSVLPEELAEFIRLAKEMGVRGLSVTIPLKETILPLVDEIDNSARQIGALNTLRFENGRIYGTNTDGKGALDAIEEQVKVRGKTVVLLGAGGAARGIAFEAKERGAHVVILNRTLERAEALAEGVSGRAGILNEAPKKYDIIVNCSPHSMPIEPNALLSSALVMDIVYAPRVTPFLHEALERGCKVVYGEEMFKNQAERQTAYWV